MRSMQTINFAIMFQPATCNAETETYVSHHIICILQELLFLFRYC